ncbi:M23 family metallopeptidase [bacterium]|nr:M23 family metallopeptidase [bacterium]
MRISRVGIALLFYPLLVLAQASNAEIIWPLNCSPQLTSSFGEFRVGHFHAGLDFRTPDGEGMSIIAPADGDIIRVRNNPWGYGKVIYYQLANGDVYIFAHLSAFDENITQRINEFCIKNRSNTSELWFKKGDFPFKAGDTLAFSGSTGAGSPHLHFEIRNGFDKAFNPGHLGYITKDTLSPRITALWAVPYGNNSSVDGHYRPVRYPIGDKLELTFSASGCIYFAIEAFDLESEINHNHFGIHEISLEEKTDTLFHFLADTFSYSRTRQIGLIYDLGLQEEFELKRPPLKLIHPFGADVSLLKGTSEGFGLINISDDTVISKLTLADFCGNKTGLNIEIKPSLQYVSTELWASEEHGQLMFHSLLSKEDTLGFRFECSIDDKLLRDRIPTEGIPTRLKSETKSVRIRVVDSPNCVALWNSTEGTKPEISYKVFGSDNIILQADFHEPPPSLPKIEFAEMQILPEMINDTSFTFRVFDYPLEEEAFLTVGREKNLLNPSLFVVEDNLETVVGNGVLRLNVPKGGVFHPFIATDNFIEVFADSGFQCSIEPAGVMLRSKACITLLSEKIDNLNEKTCIIQIWRGDTVFLSSERDEDNNLYAKIGAFGTFALAEDTLAPLIEFLHKPNARFNNRLIAKIEDDLSGFSNKRLPQSYIDDVWVPTEYDSDKNEIAVDIKGLDPGNYVWKVIAIDVAGNSIKDEIHFNKI